MKQTAVSWLAQQLVDRKLFESSAPLTHDTLEHLVDEAKQMEKRQILEADLAGVKRTVLNVHTNLVKIPHVLKKIEEIEKGELNHENGEQYYADTFKR